MVALPGALYGMNGSIPAKSNGESCALRWKEDSDGGKCSPVHWLGPSDSRPRAEGVTGLQRRHSVLEQIAATGHDREFRAVPAGATRRRSARLLPVARAARDTV